MSTAAELLTSIQSRLFPIVVVQSALLESKACDLLELVRAVPVPVMMIFLLDGTNTMPEAIRLIRMGAYQAIDTGTGGVGGELTLILEAAKEEVHCRRMVEVRGDHEHWRSLSVGDSAPMQDLARIIELVASRRCTVLITGETGTGKEMAARAIHMAGGRSRFPMVALNCSAIPEHLLEAELFGHTKGAFTGAVTSRIGRFEEANNSTLFLDEIGDMPLDLQAKLLRVLQERELQRLGSSETVKLNVRVIAASNLNLLERVKLGQFREDLYYRLNVVPIQMPPLRQRRGDIRLLTRHFVHKVCKLENIPLKELYNETIEHLSWYSWPGNVRQLENLVEMAVVMSGDRPILYPSDFLLPTEVARPDLGSSMLPFAVPDTGVNFAHLVNSFERSILDQVLQKANGNRTLAADLLRIPRTTLVSKLRVMDMSN
ncbi:MAG: sigma-54 dependent transcriptional regulator [Candidatus Solibacter sp.]